MSFKSFKEKAIKFKNTTVTKVGKFKRNTVSKAANKLAGSSLVLKTEEDLAKIIAKSKNTTFTSEKTLETKEFTKHSIVIFVKKKSEFYKDALVQVPVLATKAFASNISLKMCDLPLTKLKKYKVKTTPSLALFTNEKLEKLIV